MSAIAPAKGTESILEVMPFLRTARSSRDVRIAPSDNARPTGAEGILQVPIEDARADNDAHPQTCGDTTRRAGCEAIR